MDMNIPSVTERLHRSRSAIDRLMAPNSPGVYALFVGGLGAVGGIPAGEDGLIYVGVSNDLAAREFEQHFSSNGTGFSTVRRSIGAILKSQLHLEAIPRSTWSQPSLYRFRDDGELRLTNWMRDNLEVGVCSIGEALAVEAELIMALKPALNLTKWENPVRAEIKRLRKICACEAQGG
jgi:hypothetical protein